MRLSWILFALIYNSTIQSIVGFSFTRDNHYRFTDSKFKRCTSLQITNNNSDSVVKFHTLKFSGLPNSSRVRLNMVDGRSWELAFDSKYFLNNSILAFSPPSYISSLSWDAGMTIACFILSTLWILSWTSAVQKGKLKSTVSRKIIHCGSGPLFIFFWPFFSEGGRYAAATVPLLQAVRLVIAGLSSWTNIERDEGGSIISNPLVAAVSRSGNAKEAAGGPLIYVLVVAAVTLLGWRNNMAGIIAICQMAAGDGLADLVGRHFKGKKWWFSSDKSYFGSLAFFVGGCIVTFGLLSWLHFMGCVTISFGYTFTRVVVISAFCSMIEALSMGGIDDNLSVPFAAALLSQFFFAEKVMRFTK